MPRDEEGWRTTVKGNNGDVRVSSEDGEIRIEIEFQDGRSRRTDLTWENARRFAYGILEETDKAIAPEVDAE